MLARPPLIARLLAEENAAGGPSPLADAAGAEGHELFKAGDIEAAGMAGKMQMFLIRKVRLSRPRQGCVGLKGFQALLACWCFVLHTCLLSKECKRHA